MPCWWHIHKLAILKGTETNQRKQLNGSHQTEVNTHHEDPCASLELLSKDLKRGLLPLALLSLENRDLKMLLAIFPPPQRRRSSTGKTQHSDGDHFLLSSWGGSLAPEVVRSTPWTGVGVMFSVGRGRSKALELNCP